MNGRPTGDDREPRAVRLIFAYDGDEVRLESRQPATMLAPAGDAVEGFDDHTGFWTEVRDAQGTVLHRQILHDPMRSAAEVFSPDPDRSIRRVPDERPSGVFWVVVPVVPGADHVSLMGVADGGQTVIPVCWPIRRAMVGPTSWGSVMTACGCPGSKSDGTFAAPELVIANFGYDQGWRAESHPRTVADRSNDGRAVGFRGAGVFMSRFQPL